MLPTAVLVAVPDNWRTEVVNHLTSKQLPVVEALTYEEALLSVKFQATIAIITVADWIVSTDGTLTSLWENIQQDIPLLMLVAPGNNYGWMDTVFNPPLHDYSHIPFSLDQIDAFMKRNGIYTDNQ